MAKKTRKEKERASRRAAATASAATSSGMLSTYRPVIDRLLFGLAMLGVLVTIHLWIQQGRGFDQGCWGFNPPQGGEALFNCEAVVTSGAGSLFGISNVYWGMLFYGAVSVLGFLIMKASAASIGLLKRVRAGFIGFGFLYSMYLVNYQINSIGELCALCLTSAGIATALFVIQIGDLITGKDARPAVGNALAGERRLYTGIAVALAVLAGADLIYFNNLPEPQRPATAAVAPAESATPAVGDRLSCMYDTRYDPVADYMGLVSEYDPAVGAEDAEVVVMEFFDPNCPHCQSLHPIMKQAIAMHGDSVRFVFKPHPIRDYSVPQIEAMYAADEQGKFLEMLEAQMNMRRTTGISVSELRDIASDIGMDTDQLNARLRSGVYRRVMIDQRTKVQAIGMNSVPAVLVNGRFTGSRSVECMTYFIQQAVETANS